MTKMTALGWFLSALVTVPTGVTAQTSELSPAVRGFVSVNAPVVALTSAKIIDGTGGQPRDNQTVIIRGGSIVALGGVGVVEIPAGADVHDLTGKTVIPGLVMVHEHMFYPAGQAAYNQQEYSFPRLYLAGGVTTMRTGGSRDPYGDLNLRKAIDEGRIPGPKIDVTGPYLNGPGLPILFVNHLSGADDARRMVEYWAGEGATSFKAYMHVSRAELAAAVEAAHARGLKVTGHLCSVTYREAADIGIDNLEHGFFASTDFVRNKEPDTCPSGQARNQSFAALDPDGPEATALIEHLVAEEVAVTSTLTVFETSTPGQPRAPTGALDAMAPDARDRYLRQWSAVAQRRSEARVKFFHNMMKLERRFVDAGGLLVAGTDPTGYGGVVAGYANQRAVELLVQAGFNPIEAIRIATANGAEYLGILDNAGTIEVGKVADLVVIDGDPSNAISDIRKMEIVFKDGVGYDSKRLFDSVRGTVGIR